MNKNITTTIETNLSKSKVIVIGAGIAGLTSAIALAQKGAKIELYEQAKSLGETACSWFAGGMLAPWCEAATADQLIAKLGEESIGWWQRHYPKTKQMGTLVVAMSRDDGELDRFASRTSNYRKISNNDLLSLEPDIGERFNRALFFDKEAHIAPREALAYLHDHAERLGVCFHFGQRKTTKDFSPGQLILDCRGFHARDKLDGLRGVRGEMLIVSCRDVHLSRPVRLLHPRVPVYIVPYGDGRFMIGATMIECSDIQRVTVRSALDLLGSAYSLHPAFGEAEIIELGSGVRPAYEDNLPRVTREGQVVYFNGLYRHGYLLAPAFACKAVDILLEKNDETTSEWH